MRVLLFAVAVSAVAIALAAQGTASVQPSLQVAPAALVADLDLLQDSAGLPSPPVVVLLIAAFTSLAVPFVGCASGVTPARRRARAPPRL